MRKLARFLIALRRSRGKRSAYGILTCIQSNRTTRSWFTPEFSHRCTEEGDVQTGALVQLVLGIGVMAGAIGAVARKVEPRLVLVLAGLVLGLLAGHPMQIVRKLLQVLAD